MAENNESVETNNTDTESIILNEISANSTPRAIDNKVSLEDLFQLIKTQNNQLREQIDEKFVQQNIKFHDKFNQLNSTFNVKFDSFDTKLNVLKKQSNLQNVKLNLSLIHI